MKNHVFPKQIERFSPADLEREPRRAETFDHALAWFLGAVFVVWAATVAGAAWLFWSEVLAALIDGREIFP